jgi:hypothetical protein
MSYKTGMKMYVELSPKGKKGNTEKRAKDNTGSGKSKEGKYRGKAVSAETLIKNFPKMTKYMSLFIPQP